MKKRLLALLLAGLMVMSLAACGSDAQEETTGEETGTDGQDFGGANWWLPPGVGPRPD